jgi:hypothetical protein
MNYKRKGLNESLRVVLRAIDLLFLITRITQFNQSPVRLKELVLVELGPGPTRLSFLKRLLFKEVVFIDIMNYGISDPSLLIHDLSKDIPLPEEIFKSIKPDDSFNTIYMADHCLEHLPFKVILDFFGNYKGSFIFRVPNVRSISGLQDFRRDSTHLTAFDDQQLELIRSVSGINIMFWTRFYAAKLDFFSHFKNPELYAKELCIYEMRI